MTKKDYEQIAVVFGNLYRDMEQTLSTLDRSAHAPAVLRMVDNARREMESVLKSDNSRFDADRFAARVMQISEGR